MYYIHAYIYICIYRGRERKNHFPIYQKLAQYCKSNTHQQQPKSNLTSDFIVANAKSINI